MSYLYYTYLIIKYSSKMFDNNFSYFNFFHKKIFDWTQKFSNFTNHDSAYWGFEHITIIFISYLQQLKVIVKKSNNIVKTDTYTNVNTSNAKTWYKLFHGNKMN